MLTDTKIKRAISGATKKITLIDGSHGRGGGSLRLLVRPGVASTSAVWVAWWKLDGKPAEKRLGRYPDLSLAQARSIMLSEISPLLHAGKNPRVQNVAEGKPTVGRMFEAYVNSMKAKGRVSADEVERALLKAQNNAADAIGRNRLAADIESADVVAFVSTFFRNGSRGQADKARSYVSSAFNWALKSANDYTIEGRQDWGVKLNPAASIPRDGGAVGQRERNLSAAELRELWRGLDDFSLEMGAVIKLLIATGQRVQEVLRIDGAEIDLESMLWNMPAEKTKGRKRPHSVPLPELIRDPLAAVINLRGDGPLFPGASNGRMCHRSVMQSIDRWLMRDDVNVSKFQTRDIRRTWKSRAHDAGIDRFTRDLIQQHAQNDTGSKHYDRAEYLPQMREAMDKWGAWLTRHVVGSETH